MATGSATNREISISHKERRQIERQAAAIVTADETTAVIERDLPPPGTSGFHGPGKQDSTAVMTVDCDYDAQPSADFIEPRCNAIADIAGNHFEEIQKEDLVTVIDKLTNKVVGRFRVRYVQPKCIAGANTTTRLQLYELNGIYDGNE